MIELILIILILPIIELIGTLIFDKLTDKIKWQPFEKQFNESLSNNREAFSMIQEPNGKIVLWFAIGFFIFFWILGIVLAVVLAHMQNTTIIESVIMVILFTAICFPSISICMHYVTKKFFVTEEQLFIKSIFIKKKYNFKDILDIDEKSKNVNNFMNKYKLVITFQNKIIKIPDYYSNYDLLKDVLFSFQKMTTN